MAQREVVVGSRIGLHARPAALFVRAAAAQAVHSDGFVKDLVNLFDAKVVDSTIREDRK